jgi:beta-lactamase class A
MAGGRAAPRAGLRTPWAALALAIASLGGVVAGSGIVMTPPSVAGRAVDIHGAAVAGAAVKVRQGASLVASGSTDAHGRFQLSGGSRLRSIEVDLAAPDYLLARAGGPVVVLHRRPTVQGRAIDDAGAGIAYARVSVELSGGATVEAMTDGDGFFSFDVGLLPGRALVMVIAPGHDAYESLADLAADAVDQVPATMARQLAWIELTTDPAGFAPKLDGSPLAGCERTPCSAAVLAGNHEVTIDDSLYVPWTASLALYEGAHVPLVVSLQRKIGTLAIAAPAGPDALLLVDGQAVPAGGWTGTLPTGTHMVSFTSADRWPWSQAVEVRWNETTNVSVGASTIATDGDQAFLANMAAYLDSLPGRYGVYLSDLIGSRVIAYHAGDSMEAASVIKLPLAVYVEQQAQAGALKMDDQVQLQDTDFMGGTGTLQSTNSPGDKISYHDLLALLVQQSDNTAWQALDRVLGSDKVDAYAASIGAPDCHQQDDQCTAAEAGRVTAQLAAGKLLDAGHTRDLVNLLETTVFNDRINYYLSGMPIAHKVGMDGGVMNDTGVVFAGRPFVVSVFTDSDDPDLGIEVIRLISRAAAQLYGR